VELEGHFSKNFTVSANVTYTNYIADIEVYWQRKDSSDGGVICTLTTDISNLEKREKKVERVEITEFTLSKFTLSIISSGNKAVHNILNLNLDKKTQDIIINKIASLGIATFLI